MSKLQEHMDKIVDKHNVYVDKVKAGEITVEEAGDEFRDYARIRMEMANEYYLARYDKLDARYQELLKEINAFSGTGSTVEVMTLAKTAIVGSQLEDLNKEFSSLMEKVSGMFGEEDI